MGEFELGGRGKEFLLELPLAALKKTIALFLKQLVDYLKEEKYNGFVSQLLANSFLNSTQEANW